MKHRLVTLIPSILAVVSLAACESVEPPEVFDVEIDIQCSACAAPPTGDNLRLSLYPVEAVLDDRIDATRILSAGNHRVLESTIVTAFRGVPRGVYMVIPAALQPRHLMEEGGCDVTASSTARPIGAPDGYPDWVYVKAPLPPQTVPTITLSC